MCTRLNAGVCRPYDETVEDRGPMSPYFQIGFIHYWRDFEM